MFNSGDVQAKTPAELEKLDFDKNVNKLKNLLGEDFHYIKHLGAGVAGDVYLCRYTGNHENIKKLCDIQSRLCVKIPAKKFDLNDESALAEELFQKQSSPIENQKYIVGVPIKNQETVVALCMNYVSTKDTATETIAFSLKSFLKSFFQSIVYGHVKHKEFSDKVHNGLYQDIGIHCVQLINEMHSILKQFNAMGYLHLDIGARNFILNKPIVDDDGNLLKLSLVLCDYGLSGKCNEQGVVNTVHQSNKKPLTARDYHDIAENKASVHTDIYALKTAIIGMIALIITDVMHDYSILTVGQKTIEEFYEMRTKKEYYKSDTIVLTQFLQCMTSFMSLCPDPHVRNQINQLIFYFREYILTLPDDNLSGDLMHQFDQDKLMLANEKYFNHVVESKCNNIKDINNENEIMSLLLSIKRLMMIPVTEEFKKSAKYQQIKALDNGDKIRDYIADRVKVENIAAAKAKLDPIVTEGSAQLKWIDKINQHLNEWRENRKENFQEIKWFGQEIEKRANQIINDIITGKIKSLDEAQQQYINIVRDINHKISVKKNSSQDKPPSLLSKMTLNTTGYASAQTNQTEVEPIDVPKNVSGYEGEQIEQKEIVRQHPGRKKRDK